MTIIGTVVRPNGTSVSSFSTGETRLELVSHVPGSGQYKLAFVPPLSAVPAVTVNHVWSTTADDWGGSAGDRAAIEFITHQYVGVVTSNDRGTLVDRFFSLTIIGP